MKRLLVVLLGCIALFAAAPGQAQARECGLPNKTPLWIDFADGSVPYWQMFAQPGVIAAAANFIFPPQIRALGAKTVYWEMNLRAARRDADEPDGSGVVQDWADRIFYRAVASSACATPWIALNEMWGSNLATPWSPTNTQYRQNVIIFVKRLRELGARPFLLLSTRPFTDGEAGDWWREASLYTDFVREIYFNAPPDPRPGRDSRIADAAQRVPPGRDRPDRDRDPALEDRHLPRLPHEPGQGGREGLKPASAWFNTIKWQVLAAKQVSREIPFATIWSWGWGEWSAPIAIPTSRPPPASISGRAIRASARAGGGGARLRPFAHVGQLNVPPRRAVHDAVGPSAQQRARGPARVTGDREIAYTSLFARLVLKGYVKVKHKELRAAERAIVRYPVRRERRGVSRRPRPRGRVSVDRARRDRGRAPAVRIERRFQVR